MTDQEATQKAPDGLASNGAQAKEPIAMPGKATKARKPTKQFPTVRIAAAKQLDLLRAFDAAAGPSANAVGLAEVSKLIGMTASTISLANPLFVGVGLLRKLDSNKFAPVPEVREYVVAYEWNKEIAAHKLAPIFRRAWFWEALEAQLKFKSTMPEHEASALIAQAAEATADYKQQIMWCLFFLEASGLIEREEGMVRSGAAYGQLGASEQPVDTKDRAVVRDGGAASPSKTAHEQAGGNAVATTFTQQPEGMLRFHVSVNVEMTEMRDWKPERITALFAGIAKVLAAKADVEQGAGDDT